MVAAASFITPLTPRSCRWWPRGMWRRCRAPHLNVSITDNMAIAQWISTDFQQECPNPPTNLKEKQDCIA